MEPLAPSAPRGAERAEAVAAEPVPVAGARVGAQQTGPEGSGRASRGGQEAPLRLRLGRARRRAGLATPTPSWKMEDDGVLEVPPASASAPAARRNSASASARQLGASLWEIHDVAREVRRSRRRPGRGIAAGREHGDGGGEVGQVWVSIHSIFTHVASGTKTEWIAADSVPSSVLLKAN